jgi:hypothetical protein
MDTIDEDEIFEKKEILNKRLIKIEVSTQTHYQYSNDLRPKTVRTLINGNKSR